jgi:hypothetical protein
MAGADAFQCVLLYACISITTGHCCCCCCRSLHPHNNGEWFPKVPLLGYIVLAEQGCDDEGRGDSISFLME